MADGLLFTNPMFAFLSDLRYAFRMLQKSPLFASVAIASLALGLGGQIALRDRSRGPARHRVEPLPCSQLYGVTPTDSFTFLFASFTMLLVSLFSGFLPARRAATVDPVIALRCE